MKDQIKAKTTRDETLIGLESLLSFIQLEMRQCKTNPNQYKTLQKEHNYLTFAYLDAMLKSNGYDFDQIGSNDLNRTGIIFRLSGTYQSFIRPNTFTRHRNRIVDLTA